MGPLIGAMLGGGASGIFGGAGGGGLMGGLMGSLMKGGGLSGLMSSLSSLFGGGQQSNGTGGGQQQTEQLLGDIKNMLSQLIDQKAGDGSGGCGGPSHGLSPEGCQAPPPGGGCEAPSHGYEPKPSCGGHQEPGCERPKEPECCGSEEAGHEDWKEHACGGDHEPIWDGKDKSPSLDRERGAARLLEQAKTTDDPEQKRELIDMALDMLGKGPKKDGLFAKVREERDGNSYDKDIVKQAEGMLDQIDEGHLSGSNESKALDSVIDMLMQEGGVDGKPAASDTNGDGRRDRFEGIFDHPVPTFHHHQHLHGVLFDDH